MLESSMRSMPRVPSPEPVLTATLQEVPEPLTEVMLAPETPDPLIAKSEESTPLTLSEKTTLKLIPDALVGVAFAREMETTDGGVVSRV
jgi:hypothetical protein